MGYENKKDGNDNKPVEDEVGVGERGKTTYSHSTLEENENKLINKENNEPEPETTTFEKKVPFNNMVGYYKKNYHNLKSDHITYQKYEKTHASTFEEFKKIIFPLSLLILFITSFGIPIMMVEMYVDPNDTVIFFRNLFDIMIQFLPIMIILFVTQVMHHSKK